MVTFDELANEIFNFRSQLQDFETEIYIVAGVLGGACAVLLLCFFIMICVVIRVNKSIKEVEENKRVAAEINARKFSAYTGEEVHRRLKSAVPQEPGNSSSEYAFNHPVNTNYAINSPPAKF